MALGYAFIHLCILPCSPLECILHTKPYIQSLMEKECQATLVEGYCGIPGAWGQPCMKVKNSEPSLETRSGGV